MTRRESRPSRLVYSTEHGSSCPRCGHPLSACRCAREASAPTPAGPVRVGRETSGRRGKGVTVIRGLPLAGDRLGALTRDLKKRCGTGGTVKDGAIEIQGDHRDALVEELRRLGYDAKRSGG